MAGVDKVKLAVRQPFVEVFRVDEWYNWVSAARDNLHGCLYVRQQGLQCFKLRRVRLHVADRVCESIALVRSEVVLASGIGDLVALERPERTHDARASTDPPIRLEVLCEYPFAQRISELNRNGHAAGTYDEAQEALGV